MSSLNNIVEVTEADFQQQVVERSKQIPVLVDFWADWCAPCKMMLPVLQKLAEEYQSGFLVAKVNTDLERSLAEQHGIRSLPTLRLYRNGEVVEEILGAQPESTLRGLIEAYMERASDRVLQQGLELQARGETAKALELLEQAHQQDPGNQRLHLEYARLCIENLKLERARQLLDTLPRELRENSQGTSLQALLEFAETAEQAPEIEALQTALAQDPGQSQARYQLAARYALAGRHDAALDQLMELLKRDRGYGDGAARRGLLAVFGILGDDDERVISCRRKMFALLH